MKVTRICSSDSNDDCELSMAISGDVPPGSFDSVKGHDRAEAVGQDVLADAAPRRGYDGRARARGCQL